MKRLLSATDARVRLISERNEQAKLRKEHYTGLERAKKLSTKLRHIEAIAACNAEIARINKALDEF